MTVCFMCSRWGFDLIPESRDAWEEVGEFLKIVYQLRIAPEGKVVKR